MPKDFKITNTICKLGNITDYIYVFFIYELIIGVTPPPPGLADKILCMPKQSLHHIVHIFTLYIISMT